jgi:hypothetical protein
MELSYLFFHFVLLVFCFRFFSKVSPITIFVLIWFTNYLMYYLINSRIVDPASGITKTWSALPYSDYFSVSASVSFIIFIQSFIVVIFGVISKVFFEKRILESAASENSPKIKVLGISKYLPLSRIKSQIEIFHPIAILLLFTLTFLHYLVIKWDLVYFNTTYLTISDPQLMGFYNPELRLLHQSMIILGMLSYVLYENSKIKYGKIVSLAVLVPYIYFFTIYLAASSRSAAILISAPLLFSLIREKWLLSAVWLGVFCLVFTMCIIGRAQSILGIYAIPDNFILAIGSFNSIFLGLLINVFQGVNILGEALLLSPPNYTSEYKLLSFSPFPSFIDGFTLYSQVRVTDAVPYNNISELYYFGTVYQIIYIFVLSFCCTITHLAVKLAGHAGRISTISLFSLSIMITTSYPIRNSFRIELITCIIAFYIIKSSKVNSAKKKLF